MLHHVPLEDTRGQGKVGNSVQDVWHAAHFTRCSGKPSSKRWTEPWSRTRQKAQRQPSKQMRPPEQALARPLGAPASGLHFGYAGLELGRAEADARHDLSPAGKAKVTALRGFQPRGATCLRAYAAAGSGQVSGWRCGRTRGYRLEVCPVWPYQEKEHTGCHEPGPVRSIRPRAKPSPAHSAGRSTAASSDHRVLRVSPGAARGRWDCSCSSGHRRHRSSESICDTRRATFGVQ